MSEQAIMGYYDKKAEKRRGLHLKCSYKTE